MLYERKQLKELIEMKHRHDSDNNYVKYDEIIIEKSASSYLYRNDIMRGFLIRLQPIASLIIDHMNVVKNFKNYIVDKYYYKHIG